MIKIQKAQSEDMKAILQLQYVAYQSEAQLNNDFTIQPLMQTLDELIAEYQKSVILKAVQDGKIIGSVRAYADGDTVYIGKLIVHPDHQGKGLGKRLLAAIEGKLHRKRFELFTGLKSERNLHLYEKAGYTRFREETNDAGITFVFMEKKYDDGTNIAVGLSLGVAIGVLIGTLTDNIGLWLSIGLCIGIAVGSTIPGLKKKTKTRDDKTKNKGEKN